MMPEQRPTSLESLPTAGAALRCLAIGARQWIPIPSSVSGGRGQTGWVEWYSLWGVFITADTALCSIATDTATEAAVEVVAAAFSVQKAQAGKTFLSLLHTHLGWLANQPLPTPTPEPTPSSSPVSLNTYFSKMKHTVNPIQDPLESVIIYLTSSLWIAGWQALYYS